MNRAKLSPRSTILETLSIPDKASCAKLPYRACGGAPPVITSPLIANMNLGGFFYEVTVANFDPTAPGHIIEIIGMPPWMNFNYPPMIITGIPPYPGDYVIEIIVTTPFGSDRQPIIFHVVSLPTTARWGRNPIPIIGETEVLQLSAGVFKATIHDGSYPFMSADESGYYGGDEAYLYVWTGDSLGVPGVRSQNKGWMAGAFLSAMAFPADGYTSVVNEWYYLPLTIEGQTGKLWRSLNRTWGAQIWTCTI